MKAKTFGSILLILLGIAGFSFLFLMVEKMTQGDDAKDSSESYSANLDEAVDKTTEIQKAIDDTPAGGTLEIPPGVYKLSKNPDLKAVTGYGDSYFALKISKPITILMEEVIFQTDTDDEYGVFWVNETEDVHLKGGFLMGERLPEDGYLTSHIAILFLYTDNSTIEDTYMKNFSQGVHLNHSDHNIVRKVTSEFNYGSGIIIFDSNQNLIDSCVVRNSGDGHLSLYGGGEDNHVLNCMVTEDRPGYDDQQGITVESETGSLIENNTVSGFYYGIDVKNASESNVIESNIVFNNEYNIAVRGGDGGENLQLPSYDTQILNNMAVDPRDKSSYGIYVDAGDGHVVIGNTVNIGNLVLPEEDMAVYESQNYFVPEED
ncbi:right-handed parallel beta-helix repeat-containing protein [Planococcus sp. CPCC 101016]|uniref:right-handed parallel beta-helix repeat-containing protein n=1 Tax=Planococcus sp. CPCC 101016 TaxID=2599617 RepID=UPI0011B7A7AF|nr:right-handed parallel beta-helix repeat-containing protein [Planococcus sp. CPCC 101016]TWT07109.1 right-handed parallel beta-helix repeat-containing protein [Planococcus sp. CPCC 101016]